MSEKGKHLYEDRVENFKTRLLRTWTQVHRSLDYYPPPGTSVNSCERLFAQLEESYMAYDAVVNDFKDYLTRTSTIESNIEIIKLNGQHEGKKELYLEFCEQFNKEKLNIETGSKRTAFTQRSKSSARMDSLLAAKQANVQAARARVVFTQKEAAMRREQAIIEENERVTAAAALRRKAEFETELLLLSQQKEVACAQAEAEALEQYGGGSAKHSLPDLPESDPMQRVEQFVNAVKTENNELKMEPVPVPTRLKPVSVPPGLEPVPVSTKLKPVTVLAAAQPEPSPVVWDFEEFKPMDAHASRTEPPRDAVTDFTQYLLKKDLLLSRLTFFDDKPENYVMWKTGFKRIVTELGVTSPLEELDLLIKWLGSVSSKQAVSIRASNASDPLKGLRRIWERLDERYGSPEIIEDALKKKLQKFPRLTVKDNKPLYELFDIVSEIESVKEDPKYSTLLSYFDSSAGVSQIVEKLPYNLKEKWVARASSYKETHHVSFPPFSFFVKFIGDMSRIRNDPSFYYENEAKVPKEYTPRNEQPRNVFTRKTDILPKPVVDRQCPLHGTNHELDDCRAFKLKTLQERRNFLKENYLCFKCAKTSKHRSKDCTEKVKCRECGSDKHPTALHVTPHPKPPHRNDFAQPEDTHGGEKGNTNQPKSVETKCTQVCSSNGLGKSCAKICLVKLYSNEQPEECIIGYAVIDDQSNRSLARSSLFDRLDLGDNEIEYTLSSCGGKTVSSGRVTSSCIVESLEGSRSFKIGSLLECDQIPDERDEIPTPEVARCHAHLRDIQKEIPPLNENAEILILIGRDCIEAHHVLDQRIGPPNAPYAQRIALGWVVIGEACLGKVHRTDSVNVNKTFLLSNGRPSVFTPCLNEFKVVESKGMNPVRQDGLFEISENDDVPAMSVEDREFVSIMDSEFRKDASGNWSAPLPFRSPRPKLPNNRQQAVRRAKALDASFRKDPLKKEHFITFMDKVFQNGHAELAPSLKPDEERWYLPIFGVYHPQKPGQIRAVFDSSAKYEDISLNNVMLQGPDSTNSLLGILIRFRREPVAITADIQQMFYCFKVEEKHRNFLRFLWYKDNNLDNPLTEYRMCVHVFGNSPSPAIATYGLRKTVENCDTGVKEFVNRDFYVDDGVTSKRTENQAIDLLKRTKDALEDGNLRLHKIASNSKNVMKAFPPEDLAKELKDIDFENDDLPAQRSLGVKWDLSTDSFSFSVSEEKQPLSRRQVLTSGNWSAPLPFRSPRPKLPNNRQQAVRRAKALDASFRKDPLKKEHFITFMDKVFQNGHAELAPSLKPDEERWYLPIFGVYHPQKPGQIRAVFDSSAKYEDISLNNVMLQGPDSTNSLLGILIRFRREPVAITADIQQMFYCFKVEEKHRNFLRFLWYKDNNLDNPLTEYRMCVHVFGNSPSPAIATYGLRKTVENCDTGVKEFVNRDFYVDDGVTSKRTENQAIDLLKRTKDALEDGNLRLHKIASNSKNVMKAFPPEDLAKELKDIDFENDYLPAQRSLGVKWDLSTDSFSFSVSEEKQPLSRRQVLSTINSIFDPLGFLAPVTIQGKLIMREIVAETSNWDESLSTTQHKQWTVWRDSIESLKDIQIPRTYTTEPLDNNGLTELHVFSDASEQAIAAVAYLVTGEKKEIGFVLGKAKVAPVSGHTIPRLELCAAVLAVEVSSAVVKHLGMDRNCVKYYTDSKVVLGYIYNRTKRFFTYVSNRAEKIRKGSQPKQWRYIPTHLNPADCATRGLPAETLQNSLWLTGPREHTGDEPDEIEFPIVNPDQDREIRQEVKPKKTNVSGNKLLGSSRFERCSSWKRLIGAIARLKHIASSTRGIGSCKGWHICTEARTVESYKNAEVLVLREVQSEMYAREISCLEKKVTLPKDSPIAMLDPFIGQDGLLKVGGRLSRSRLTSDEKHPTIVPGKHHIAILLVRHYHESVKHQGRHFTEGAVRAAGYWIIGGKRLISSLIFKCVGCRKLRGRFECQKMSDLPSDRLETVPPFTYVGVDTFGPWQVVSRRTRGGQANSKRWAILFTCLSIRAIHIEVVEDMSSSAFINALRRFIALRGQVKQFRSDRGTNFVGATDAIGAQTVNVEDGKVGEFLYTAKTVWLFNPPHSSHMGGVWERMIGVTRRILDSMLSGVRNLSHEVLVTLMAEVCAIVNSRPLVPVSTDCEVPEVLCPSKLLTFKNEGSEQPLGQFDLKDTYKSQWKHVQHLADTFWARWRRDYVQTLQTRRKWNREHANIQEGDVILLKDHDVGRVYWPIGRVKTVFPGVDGRIRKAEINIVKDGTLVSYIRPVVDMVLLVRSGDICDSGEVV